jgi:hypothetical protein
MSRVYSVFGGCLESDVHFPELRECALCEPRWRFGIVAKLPELADMVEIGAQHIYGEVHARLYRRADGGYRITVDDTGRFDIDPSGTCIVCEEKEGAWPDFVRAHLLGRVLATALYSRGWMPLHGSAVQFDSGVVGFLAPKGFGKSTLALSLARSGARLVTDDTLPVELVNPLVSWPGVHSVRIAADSMAAVGVASADLDTREGKSVVTSLRDEERAEKPAPLRALYLIEPRLPSSEQNDTGDLVRRELLTGARAALALLSNFKLTKMTGRDEMPEVLRRAAIVADRTSVYALSIPRDLGALATVAEVIRGWHQSGEPDATSSPLR